jgi:hypothetical protein
MNRTMWMRAWLLMAVIAAAIFASGGGAQGPKSPSPQPRSPVVIEVRGDTFDWQDAGVGATATLALVVIAFGLTLVLRDRPLGAGALLSGSAALAVEGGASNESEESPGPSRPIQPQPYRKERP